MIKEELRKEIEKAAIRRLKMNLYVQILEILQIG